MTPADIEAAWLRFMHRNDITADLPTIWAMADAKIAERIMRKSDTLPTVETAPRLWLHAGLLHLHELAHDDAGMQRDLMMFDMAAQDEAFRYSIDNVTPDPLHVPEPPAPEPVPPEPVPPDTSVTVGRATFDDGAQAVVLPTFVMLTPATVEGDFTIDGGGEAIVPAFDGDTVVEMRALVTHTWGKAVVFGVRVDDGVVEEVGRIVITSNDPVLAIARRTVTVVAGALYRFFISSDFEHAEFAWTDAEVLAVQPQE